MTKSALRNKLVEWITAYMWRGMTVFFDDAGRARWMCPDFSSIGAHIRRVER